jgi:peptidoglycan/LPS O-acetylase OafA/YrhL
MASGPTRTVSRSRRLLNLCRAGCEMGDQRIETGTAASAGVGLSPETDSHQQPSPVSRRFRSDIEGMRALAILVIVAYHAGVPGFSGGFVGVDIFFVISGYLITGILVDTADTHVVGGLASFWARRVRRLIPGLALMVVVTLIASSLIVAPIDMQEISKEGTSAALYLSNLLFAGNAQNYFASNINSSPFLHTWSLGVEEQFYLAWPLLLFGALVLGRRAKTLVHRGAAPLLFVILVASFLLNLRWTADGSSYAFFSLPTRAWEFAAGGLLASIKVNRVSRRWAVLFGCAGIALMAYGTVHFTAFTSYPGINAAVPVVGTVLLILSGRMVATTEPTVVMLGLSARPMQWIGKLSYSWYLWHWPFIVLTALALDNDGAPIRTVAAGVSLPVAYVAYRAVENPIRRRPSLARSPKKTFFLGLAITAATCAVAGTTWVIASRSTPTSFAQAHKKATKDFFPLCAAGATPQGIQYCAGGDSASSTVVALVGDSHAATWFNAMSNVALRQGVRLAGYFTPGCTIIPVVVRSAPDAATSTGQCNAERARGMRLLSQLRPKAVILTQHDGQYLGTIENSQGSIPSVGEQAHIWQKGFAAFLRKMTALGIRPAVILDDPTLPYTPAECVSRTGSLAACEPSRSTAFAPAKLLIKAERSALATITPSVPVFNPDDVLCDAAGCPLELHGHLLYLDNNHLLYGATRMMEPDIASLLASVLGAKS